MEIVKSHEVVIAKGYRLEVSKKDDDILELAYYENGKRVAIDGVDSKNINTYRDAWIFIESHIGSSIKCDFTEDAVNKIFH